MPERLSEGGKENPGVSQSSPSFTGALLSAKGTFHDLSYYPDAPEMEEIIS